MTDIAASEVKIQAEGLQSGGPVSEAVWQAMGGATNFALANVLPVGSVIMSFLDEATFQAKTSVNWVLVDNRSIVGTAMQALTGLATMPDMRGVTPRGRNVSRSTSTGNSSGDLAVGTYEGSRVGPHSHTVTDPGHSHTFGTQGNTPQNAGGTHPPPNGDGGGTAGGWGTSGGYTGLSIDGSGSGVTPESSPRSVTLNFFVRIN